MSNNKMYKIFSVLGIEIEYMLVDKTTLDIRPLSDVILKELSLENKIVNEVTLEDITISNELVMHVLELKNNGPKAPSETIATHFYKTLLAIKPLLEKYNLQFLPTGAHPWMNPLIETQRWSYGNQEIYKQYDTIFNCEGHGWSNLQSMHVNLPFANEAEFYQLHNVIRLILPLIPAIAASTPFLEGKKTLFKSSRLYFYGKNQETIPAISGDIIPVFINSIEDYKEQILYPMYRAIQEKDPQGILQYEWLNSRGAIAKFESGAIEIRIIDSQECVQADISLALVINAILELWREHEGYLRKPCDTLRLKAVYEKTLREGLTTLVDDGMLLDQWLLPKRKMSCREIWELLIEKVSSKLGQKTQLVLQEILKHGNLSERLLSAVGQDNIINKSTLLPLYKQLSECLSHNQLFKVNA